LWKKSLPYRRENKTATFEENTSGMDETDETKAAIARLDAATRPQDNLPDEDVTVRVGDVWQVLAKLERQRAQIVAYLRLLADRKEATGFGTPVPETIRGCARSIERSDDEPLDPAKLQAWFHRLDDLLRHQAKKLPGDQNNV
jgi:hypothetical protein